MTFKYKRQENTKENIWLNFINVVGLLGVIYGVIFGFESEFAHHFGWWNICG